MPDSIKLIGSAPLRHGMEEPRPRILFARGEVLDELRAGSTLPDGFLRVVDCVLEDTALKEFREALAASAVVALPEGMLRGELEEPLTDAARMDYLQNLRQRVRHAHAICLEVVERGAGPEWVEQLRSTIRELRPKSSTEALGPLTLVLVLLGPIDADRAQQLELVRAMPQFSRRYLMTSELHPHRASLVLARWVWPNAVGKLLVWLAALPKHTQNHGRGGPWYAWQAIDYGPQPSDEDVERLRRSWTELELIPPPSGGVEHFETSGNPSPPELTERAVVVDSLRRARRRLLHDVSAFEMGLRALRMTPGEGEETLDSSGRSVQSAFPGWSQVSASFGEEVARHRSRTGTSGDGSPASADAPQRDSHDDLAAYRHYIRKLHDSAANIRTILEQPPPPQTDRADPAREPRARDTLSRFAETRVRRRADAESVLMAATERDLADERFMPVSRRLSWGMVALSCALATWLSVSWFAQKLGALMGTGRLWVIVLPLAGVFLGYLCGVLVPWLTERHAMLRANSQLGGNIRARTDERVHDIEQLRKKVVEPADEVRDLRLRHIAWQQTRRHCERLLRVLRSIIDDAQVPSLRARARFEASIPDEYRNLWREDAGEFKEGAHALSSASDAKKAHELMDELVRKVPREVRRRADSSPVIGLAAGTIDSTASAGSNESAATPGPSHDAALDDQMNSAILWKTLCERIDPYQHGHFPSVDLRSGLSSRASALRSHALHTLTSKLLSSKHEERDVEAAKDDVSTMLLYHGFLSCRLESDLPAGDPIYLFPREPKAREDPRLRALLTENSDGLQIKVEDRCDAVASLAMLFRETPVVVELPERSDFQTRGRVVRHSSSDPSPRSPGDTGGGGG